MRHNALFYLGCVLVALIVGACGGPAQRSPDVEATAQAKLNGERAAAADAQVSAEETPSQPAFNRTPKGTIHFDQGSEYARQGDFGSAVEQFDDVIRLDQSDADAYFSRGVAYYRMGQFRRAIEDYDQALGLDPNNSDAFNNLGVAYLNLGQTQTALDDFDNSLQLAPGFAQAYDNRGVAFRELGDPVQAVDNHSAATLLSPRCAGSVDIVPFATSAGSVQVYRGSQTSE